MAGKPAGCFIVLTGIVMPLINNLYPAQKGEASVFLGERSIEEEREKELKKVNERFYGRSGSGMIE